MVFIYAVEEDAINGSSARKLLHRLQTCPGASLTSELSLAEVLAPNKERGKLPDRLRAAYLEIMVWDGSIALEPVTRSVLLETVDLRAVAGMKLPDAIHLATAIHTDCRYMVTNDGGMRVPDGVIKVEPDEAGVATILGAVL